MISVCGVICEKDCRAYKNNCKGCIELNGKVSWTKFLSKETCPIYKCVKDNKFVSCGQCDKRPCDIWLIETKNPSVSDTEFMKDIKNRLENLNNIYS